MLHRDSLEEAGHVQGAQGWLRSCLQTTRGTEQLYGLLQQYVQTPVFLQKLTAARVAAGGGAGGSALSASAVAEQMSAPTRPEHRHPEDDIMQASFWETVPDVPAEVWSLYRQAARWQNHVDNKTSTVSQCRQPQNNP